MVPSGLRRYLVPVVGFAVALTLTLLLGTVVGSSLSHAQEQARIDADAAAGTRIAQANAERDAAQKAAEEARGKAVPTATPPPSGPDAKPLEPSGPGESTAGKPKLIITVSRKDKLPIAPVDRDTITVSYTVRATRPVSGLPLGADGVYRIDRPQDPVVRACVRPPPGWSPVPEADVTEDATARGVWCRREPPATPAGQDLPIDFVLVVPQ